MKPLPETHLVVVTHLYDRLGGYLNDVATESSIVVVERYKTPVAALISIGQLNEYARLRQAEQQRQEAEEARE